MKTPQSVIQKRYAEKKLEDPVWQEIARRYQAGEPAKRLAFIHGKSPSLVHSVLCRLDLRAPLDTPEVREMVRLYEGGCNLNEIGRLLGCTKQNVSLHLRPRVKMKPQGSNRPPGWPDMIARGEW